MMPLAYKRALALAHACGLDWAAFALGLTMTECTCDDTDAPPPDERGMPRLHRSAHCRRHNPQPLPVPARIEDLHAPYLEDCKRRGVKPGPLPDLKWDDGRVNWKVGGFDPYFIPKDTIQIGVNGFGAEWRGPGYLWTIHCAGEPADLARLSALVTAVSEVSP